MAVFKKKKPQNDESRYMASQWKLMWIKLKKHKLAKFSMIVLAVLYFGALFADFLAPYGQIHVLRFQGRQQHGAQDGHVHDDGRHGGAGEDGAQRAGGQEPCIWGFSVRKCSRTACGLSISRSSWAGA